MAQILHDYSSIAGHGCMLTSQTFCICCLAQNVPLILLTTCKHTGFLQYLNRNKFDTQNSAVCYLCHGMLKKIEIFMQQVQSSCDILKEKASPNKKFDFFQYTQVLMLSVDPEDSPQPESVKEYQELGVDTVDPSYVQRNEFDRSEALEVNNTDLSIREEENIVSFYTEFERDTREEDFIASIKCMKCQILNDDVTLGDSENTNQLENTNVCESYNSEHNQLPVNDNKLTYTSNTINLESNTTELHTICQKESCHTDTYHSNYDNEYNDNGYDDNGNDNEYFENGTESLNINNNEIQTHSDKKKDIPNGEKKKKRKKERSGFKKIILSLEEQKAELEAKRRDKKYLDAEFKCYNCALGFLFKDTYQAHMMRHEESNGAHLCGTCSLRFASPGELRAHAALHAARARCRRCGASSSPRRAHRHRALCRRADAPRAPCHLCATVFRDASGLQQHLKRFHQSKTSMRSYVCSVCGNNYNNPAAVRTHMIKHLNRKFTCDRCSSTFSSPYTLNQHKKKHDAKPEQHYCEVCKIGYASRKSLLAHKRNALVHQQTVFECPVCHRVCPNQRALSSHITTVHSTTKDHACDTCGARYTSRKSLVRHVASHNRQPANETHACHICPSTFKSRSKLNRHLKQVCEKYKLEEELSCYYGDGIYNVKE